MFLRTKFSSLLILEQGKSYFFSQIQTYRPFHFHSLSSVAGKQCYDCGLFGDCGNFDETTEKCSVEEDGFCLTAAIYREPVLNSTLR